MLFQSTVIDEDFENNYKTALIDTAREKEIKLGTDWPWSALGEGECLVTKENKDLSVGSTYKVLIEGSTNLMQALSVYFMDNIWSGDPD